MKKILKHGFDLFFPDSLIFYHILLIFLIWKLFFISLLLTETPPHYFYPSSPLFIVRTEYLPPTLVFQYLYLSNMMS